jgi:3-hydroxyacyl-[acyl-carrier-protein] dehydratase
MRLEYFQMIDRIIALDLGERTVRSLCVLPQTSTVFEGHFPTYPLMPGVLLAECMAQTCGWLITALNKFTAMPFLVGVKEAKFRRPVFPGDELEFAGTIIHEGSGYAVGGCKGYRQAVVVCEAQITFRVMAFPSPEFRTALVARGESIEVPVKEILK